MNVPQKMVYIPKLHPQTKYLMEKGDNQLTGKYP